MTTATLLTPGDCPESCYPCGEETLCVDDECVDYEWNWGVKICDLALNSPSTPSGSLDNDLMMSDLEGLFVNLGPLVFGGGIWNKEVTIPGTYQIRMGGTDFDVQRLKIRQGFTAITACTTRQQNLILEMENVRSTCPASCFITSKLLGLAITGLANCEIAEVEHTTAFDALYGSCFGSTCGTISLPSPNSFFSTGRLIPVRVAAGTPSDPGC